MSVASEDPMMRPIKLCITSVTDYYSYRYNVLEDGTWENRKTFAYVSSHIPDGKTHYPSSRL